MQAVKLSRERAKLCDGIPQKYAKFPVQETSSAQAASSSGEGTSGDGVSAVASSGSGGAKAKQLTTPSLVSPSSSSSKTGNISVFSLFISYDLSFKFCAVE